MVKNSFVLLLAMFTLLSFESQGQNILILHNGQTRDFKKWKLFKEYVRVVRTTGNKEQIPVSEVEGYFDSHHQKRYYKRPAKSQYVFDANQLPYEFVEKITEGKIRLFKSERIVKSVLVAPPPGVNPQIEYLIEKDDVYESVLWGESSKKEGRELLKGLVRDNNELLTRASAPEFKVNLKNIMSLIDDYNLQSFQGMAPDSYKSIGSVAFYVREKEKSQDVLSVTINDSLSYNLPRNQLFTVQVPVDAPSKVCFIAGSNKVCRITSASPFMMLYYELKVKGNERNLEIERVTSKEALEYLAFLKSQ